MKVKSNPLRKRKRKGLLPPDQPKKKFFKLKGNSKEENSKHQECEVQKYGKM